MAVLTKSEGIPLYVQIRESLRGDILHKTLSPGQRLPPEEDLATKFGVSRMTVRQSISDLIEQGLLYRRHGVGTFVARTHLERDHTRLSSFVESAKAQGLSVKIRVLIAEIVPCKLKVAEALALAEGDLVARVRTLRVVEGEPVTLHDAFIPYKLIPQLLQADMEAEHLWDIYETYGFRVKRAVQRLEAREAEGEFAVLLDVDEGAPILYKERTVFTDDGTPIEFAYCYNRGDRYSLTVALER